MEKEIKNLIKEALKKLDITEVDFVVEHPADLKMGDYSTNVAMVLAKNLKLNPKELAEKIVSELRTVLKNSERTVLHEIQIAGNGFINFYLSKKFFINSIEEIIKNKEFGKNNSLLDQKIMIEYTQPNPFKPFHIGHLMSNAIGESISRLVEFSGAEIYRANYQGDVGLHVAKAIWGLIQNSHLQKDDNIPVKLKSANIGQAYVFGAQQYEKNKDEIDEINKKIYARSDETINKIYDWGFKVTMEAFEDLYKVLGTKFDFYFLESAMASSGEKTVRENIGKVFIKSDGAIVFPAEKYDPKLHTRVFITSAGLPTYETKEFGLTEEKFKTKPDMNLSIVVTAVEQADYMRVVAKALSLIHPDFENRMKHITHGMMRFISGKMGSRTGNVITGESLINDARLAIIEKIANKDLLEEEINQISEKVAIAALKYSILKQAIGADIVYDFKKSISLEGDSGPYLQYSYARANSILEKAKVEKIKPFLRSDLKNSERSDLFEISETEKLLYRFPEIVLRSAQEYAPHYIANYLIELARSFNSFYGNNLIVDKKDPASAYKVALTEAFSVVMKNGLHLLGIQAPEKM
ncbi:arginine--tRNA ligase [Candidatus Nomurabacteria bacterium CG10_big_fil_rev_8_21_14_0_10_35_16]|uniref:Arginine--tRNA ligase n=1 Tax=Candidatus Nomurabacteria bacterium CG10_big_fil_rev_8_21_14_0_10_35_16 TaxID=1974731 RepID=A0A2H0TC02_9BACT|nr:MAG: arginine--tRNA ligase [Candidatus Nomurabacteria bacterium CG10_big_fil_rev_8_21_14_0_10_35_16]